MIDLKLAKRCGYLPGVGLTEFPGLMHSHPAVADAPLLLARQCGHPDHSDEELAKSDPADISQYLECTYGEAEFIQAAHSRMLENEATGQGSFPAGCYPDEYPQNHAARVFLDFGSFPQHYTRPVSEAELEQILEAGTWGMTRDEIFDTWTGKPMLTVAMDLVNECYRIVGCAHIMTTDGAEGAHNIHIKAENIPGSVIGYAYFNNGRCGDHVNQRIDSSWHPGLHACAHLLAHECGHNHNLEHQFSNQNHHHGIMSYSSPRLFYGYSTGKSPHSLPLDPSLRILRRHYGGEPVPIDDDPTEPQPPPPVPGGTITVRVPTLPVTLRIVKDSDEPPIVF